MSNDPIQRFGEILAARPDLQEKVRAIHAEAACATAGRVADLAAESGFPFTAEEFLAGARQAEDVLGEQELQAVAGGVWKPNDVNIAVSAISFGILCAAFAGYSAATRGDADACQASFR